MPGIETTGVRQALQGFAALIIIMTGIKLGSTLIIPLLLSALLTLLANPVVSFLHRFRVPRIIGIVITLVGFLVFAMFFLGNVVSTVKEFTAALPGYLEQLMGTLAETQAYLASKGIPVDLHSATESFDTTAMIGPLTDMIGTVGTTMSFTLLILIATVFMLLETPLLPGKLRTALSSPDHELQSIRRFLRSFNRYVALKTLISLVTGLLVGTMLWAKGVNFYVLWGLVAFLLNFIPSVGSIVAAIPGVLMALLQFGFGDAMLIMTGYLAINVTIGNVIEPNVMGHGLGLSPLVVLLSLIFWGWLLGPVGMLLAVPLTMFIKIMMESSERWHDAAILLGPDGRES
ncbi:AI-2E family transporter [Parendozoicomonas haliclonae]|uniref:AI-2 transport protein TqsA n=1 Tax=Parendozoicomonas haliclonae TaxID=1960125 RepID=A0A1X7AIB7_9GAMM|nr:AI-2E family transporter [Parendozoicomonas haliclonae]SMA38532.1 AI-2 transport protein TqsA [Parendozoicomonas haliclonae]